MEETTLTQTMTRAAAEVRARRYDAANWWHLADATEDLARELAYQLSRLGVDLQQVLDAAARPVAQNQQLASLLPADLSTR